MARRSARRRVRTGATAVLAAVANRYRSLLLLRDRRLSVLAVASVLDVMSATIVVPFLPSLAADLGASPVLIGLVFTAPAVVEALATAPAGHVADRVGRRPLVWIGVTVSALPVMAIAVADSAAVLIVLRGIDALFRAVAGPATHAYIGDSYAEGERASAFGVYQTSRIAGAAAGPLVGGALAAVGGIRLPFVVLGATTLLGGLVLYAFLPPVDGRGSTGDGAASSPLSDVSWGAVRPFLTVPAVAWLLVALLSAFGEFALNPIFPLLLADTVGGGPAYVGATYSALAIAMIVFMPIGGRVADRVGRVRLLALTKVGWFAVMVGLAVATSPLVPPALLFFGGVLSAFSAPASLALRYEIAPNDRVATFGGLTGTAASVGRAGGPLFAGAATGAVGVRSAAVAAGLSWLLSVPILLVLVPETGSDGGD